MPRVRTTQPKPSKPAPTVDQLRAEFKSNLDKCVKRGLKLEDAKYAIQQEAREICDGEDCTPEMWVTASRIVLGETYTDKGLGY